MDTVNLHIRTEFSRDPKWDTSFKLGFILKGELSLYVGTKERHLHQHDFTFVRPYELYGGSNAADSCKVLVVDIQQDLWKLLYPNADTQNFSVSILRANDRSNSYQTICKSLAQIVYYNRINEGSSTPRIVRAVSDILSVLVGDFAESGYTERPSDQTASRIQRAFLRP